MRLLATLIEEALIYLVVLVGSLPLYVITMRRIRRKSRRP
ncbi:hypothetical protein J421_1692 [Gemmatirosa kalamazoonensis]|uniref:Uncharacterized protein n=1 Tax=Gemmatirosa kalamazoonensis TaxID=861299 RepID=W0RDS6_9BACT|nr:hypothetical protein J421_1692 [Gemmatirosa kalamazoonensis]